MAGSATRAVCTSCKKLIVVGAHTRDCEFCGAEIPRCSKCSAAITQIDQRVCHSCMTPLSGTPREETAWAGPAPRPPKRSLSDWQLVLVLTLITAVVLGVYAFGSGSPSGQDGRFEGSYADCMAANGYREDADIDQLAINQRASQRCGHLLNP